MVDYFIKYVLKFARFLKIGSVERLQITTKNSEVLKVSH